ncbi:oxidoreductase [Rhodobacteraceae bacterium N5(2021)]|uniref:Oxidoreductase n=1 Tax=Gymnodinialimonas phycosphaerae TaxID=2841589 RepID=A0A975TS12_9RHOB|nr:oxidoreductase [Gymnodinialimonas phycosphaerae]MBY4893888.1 oxidoreductase [Gymnodinialimonas phycosphaerae]
MNKREFIMAATVSALGFARVASANENQLLLDGDWSTGPFVNLDDSDLSALPQMEFETTTQWTTGSLRFSGPLLSDLLDFYGAGSGDLRLTAINDYSVDLSRDLVTPEAPIVANRINGEPFSRRDKGPFWVVYPYDRAVEFRTEQTFAASVWQLSQITVLSA